MKGLRSAIVVPIRLPPALEALRVREVANAHLGVPAHVTVLVPFVPPESIGDDVLSAVAAVVARTPAFEVNFKEVRRWEPSEGAPEGVVWLDPEPAALFNDLTRSIWGAFPDHLPYGGVHDKLIPHLTLATDDRRRQGSIVAEAGRHLPFRRSLTAATLLIEGVDGRWRTRRRFALGAGRSAVS